MLDPQDYSIPKWALMVLNQITASSQVEAVI